MNEGEDAFLVEYTKMGTGRLLAIEDITFNGHIIPNHNHVSHLVADAADYDQSISSCLPNNLCKVMH